MADDRDTWLIQWLYTIRLYAAICRCWTRRRNEVIVSKEEICWLVLSILRLHSTPLKRTAQDRSISARTLDETLFCSFFVILYVGTWPKKKIQSSRTDTNGRGHDFETIPFFRNFDSSIKSYQFREICKNVGCIKFSEKVEGCSLISRERNRSTSLYPARNCSVSLWTPDSVPIRFQNVGCNSTPNYVTVGCANWQELIPRARPAGDEKREYLRCDGSLSRIGRHNESTVHSRRRNRK